MRDVPKRQPFPKPALFGCWTLGILLTLVAMRADAVPDDLPRERFGSTQVQLEIVLKDLGLQQAVKDGRLAVALVLLDDKDAASLAMVNGHKMLYAASLPKIVILYGAAVALDRGRVTMSESLATNMDAMIRKSCNACSNRVLTIIGRQWLLELLQEEPYRFYERDKTGGLWVGKDFARSGAFRRDPLKGLSHAATAWQVARWYYLLNRGALASPERTKLMLDTLSNSSINHKFVKGLSRRKISAVYRKSGTWRNYHADSALVVSESASYILVALATDSRGGRWLERLAERIHDRMTALASETLSPSSATVD